MSVPVSWSLTRALREARTALLAELPAALTAAETEMAGLGFVLPDPSTIEITEDVPESWVPPYIGLYAEGSEIDEADALGAYDVTWRIVAVLLADDRVLATVTPTDYDQAVRAYGWCIAQTLGAHLATATYARQYGVWRCVPADVAPQEQIEDEERGRFCRPVQVRVDVAQRVRQVEV